MSGKEDEVYKVNDGVIPGVCGVFCDEEIAGDYFGHLPLAGKKARTFARELCI